MATSGTTSFAANRDQLITQALRLVNAVPAGETPSDILIQDTAFMLNAMVKHWQARGIHLWTVREATLFPQVNQRAYQIGTGATDHVAETYVQTELSANAVLGAGTISLLSAAGIASGNQIGIQLDDGTIFWTTVNGAPAGVVVTLANVLTDSARVGLDVFAYDVNIPRPLRVPLARRHNIVSKLDTPLTPLSRRNFHDLPNKDQPGGSVNSWWYDPQLVRGILNIWQMPDVVRDLIKFTWYKPIYDFNAAADTPDLPQEWILTLMFNLAVTIAPGHDVPEKKFQQLVTQGASYLDEVSGWDREPESVEFGIDNEGRW
jgi:hypothetical protein